MVTEYTNRAENLDQVMSAGLPTRPDYPRNLA
jgi:hypothetical protein